MILDRSYDYQDKICQHVTPEGRIPKQTGRGGDTTLLGMTTKQWTLMHIQQSKHSNTVHQYLLEILVYKTQLPSLIFIL